MRIFVLTLVVPICLLISACGKSSLPQIKDVDALRRECADLSKQLPPRARTNDAGIRIAAGDQPVSGDQWPPSIKALQPIMVNRGEYGFSILIKYTKPDALDLAGYYVFDDAEMAPPRSGPSTRLNDRFYFGERTAKGIYKIVSPSIIR